MQLNTWDDHEIFDGWGSYPPHLQNCSAFATVFKLAKRMYAAFQLHTTVKTQKSDGYFTAQARPSLAASANKDCDGAATVPTAWAWNESSEYQVCILGVICSMPHATNSSVLLCI